MARAGDYDRRIQIVRLNAPQAEDGQQVPTGEPTVILETWASWRQVRGDEAFLGNQRLATVEVVVEIPFPGGPALEVRATDEVRYHGVRYDLIEAREVGRREKLQLLVRRRPAAAVGPGPGTGP